MKRVDKKLNDFRLPWGEQQKVSMKRRKKELHFDFLIATMLRIEISSRSNVHQQVVNLKIKCVIKLIAFG